MGQHQNETGSSSVFEIIAHHLHSVTSIPESKKDLLSKDNIRWLIRNNDLYEDYLNEENFSFVIKSLKRMAI